LCVFAEKSNSSSAAAAKQVKNASVAAINQEQKDSVVNSNLAAKSMHDLLTSVATSNERYL